MMSLSLKVASMTFWCVSLYASLSLQACAQSDSVTYKVCLTCEYVCSCVHHIICEIG